MVGNPYMVGYLVPNIYVPLMSILPFTYPRHRQDHRSMRGDGFRQGVIAALSPLNNITPPHFAVCNMCRSVGATWESRNIVAHHIICIAFCRWVETVLESDHFFEHWKLNVGSGHQLERNEPNYTSGTLTNYIINGGYWFWVCIDFVYRMNKIRVD